MASNTFTYSILQGFGTYNSISQEYYQYMDKEAVRKRASALERWAIERIKNNIDVDVVEDFDINITNTVIADADPQLCKSDCNITVDFDNYLCAKNEKGYNTGKQYANRLTVKNYIDGRAVNTDTYELKANYSGTASGMLQAAYSQLTETELISRVTSIINRVLTFYPCGVGKTLSDFNIDASLAVQPASNEDCALVITYRFTYDFICMIEYKAHGTNTIGYVRQSGKKIVSTVTVHVLVNEVEDPAQKMTVAVESYNTVPKPNDAPSWISSLSLLTSAQAENVKNSVENYLKSVLTVPDLVALDPFIYADTDCVSLLTAQINGYKSLVCSLSRNPSQKYATVMTVAYNSFNYTDAVDYDIRSVYNNYNMSFFMSEEYFLNNL